MYDMDLMTIEDLPDRPTRKYNRVMSHRPRGGVIYCGSCDRDLVEDGKKCGTCGVRHPLWRRKKTEDV